MKATVGDLELGYIQQGQGQPVVLIHGFPLNKSMWEHQVQALAGRYRVVAVDLRGHGESRVVEAPADMDTYADDVKALLDHLDISQAVIAGFSMGGYVAFAFYRRHPGAVKALVLADTRPQPDTAEAAQGRRNTAQMVLDSQAITGVVDGTMLPRMFTEATAKNNLQLVEHARQIMYATPVPAVSADLLALAGRADSVPTLETITCPTLIVVGEEDQITPLADAELMAARIPNARLEKIPGAAHLVPMEQPAAFNQALTRFLDSLTP